MNPAPTLGHRRVVTGLDAGGRSIVTHDGTPRHVEVFGGVGVWELLWLAGRPTSTQAEVDRDPADPGFPLEPPTGGASVRVVRLGPPPPGTPVEDTWLRIDGDDPEAPGMHATDTLDLDLVLDGRIVLGLDDDEVELGPGDLVVQRGTRHRWRVVGDRPCTYAVVMLRPDPAAPAPAVALRAPGTLDAGEHGPRRVVTATGEDGRSFVLDDGRPPVAVGRGGDDGTRLVEVWQTGGPLVTVDQGGERTGPFTLGPVGAGGVSMLTVELGASHDPGEAGWHATDTIDVDLVLDGRLRLELPGTEPIELGPGDSVVQRGTNHRWTPVGGPVRWFAVMIGVTAGGTT